MREGEHAMIDHRNLGPRAIHVRRYRRVVEIVPFYSCEAIAKGERCRERMRDRRPDHLGVWRAACLAHMGIEAVFPIVMPLQKAKEWAEPPRALRPLVVPARSYAFG